MAVIEARGALGCFIKEEIVGDLDVPSKADEALEGGGGRWASDDQ